MKRKPKFHAIIMSNSFQILRPKTLCKKLGISIPTLYRWEAQGKFPVKKIKIGPNSVGYRSDEFEKWLEEKADQTETVA
jgi:predicted DNA-binding transcriptional regulator AlpA